MQQREIFETRASTYPNAFWSIWQICCFCFVCCMMYLCICVFVVWCIYVSVCCLLRPEICYVSSSSIAFYFIYWDGIFHWTGSSGIPQAPGILPSLPAQHWVSGACLAFYVAWVFVLAMQAYWLSSFAGSQFSSCILSTLHRIGRSHDQTPSPKLREKYN